ncbi:hypothetical protein [Brevundimonas lenta]|uniref:Uncharacterized protein n=1 Tax=Brevundimonas lenta TaxID=424796 RepID=A0A7W6JCX0_9CAUL|nr:hypothetical protein [Brevundimonas lenta]MBB4081853.1 hypothetical protein [Brevundimonas lenta]
MATHFLIDGMLSGTGVRDGISGGYVEPGLIGISPSLVRDISAWQQRYEGCHFEGFPAELVSELDTEGMVLAVRAGAERPDLSIGYFSNGLMKRMA